MKSIFFILFFFFYYTSSAKTIPVGSNKKYKTITAGIDVAFAGDTVLVDAGN